MEYQLENLGPERFQLLCQALLAKLFPRVQCLPIAQPDGGRDAITPAQLQKTDEFLVFQVKFSRKPMAELDPHIWLTDTVRGEAPKVAKLVPAGAREYYLLTNVPGTAHPHSGSIDRVQEILTHELPIPAQCWWRNDICRRLDDAWDIKWQFPEILTAPDILRHILTTGLGEHAERRTNAIASFLADQLERDKDVRFKQVELQNRLLDLFIDVPIDVRACLNERQLKPPEAQALLAVARMHAPPEASLPPHELPVGAATLLLAQHIQDHIPRIVLEGAPGQGKSTIAQYLCQVHRQRVLGLPLDDPGIPETHRQQPIRLPFKIDCRDLALWLSKKNPFVADEPEALPAGSERSLEGFLAASVCHFSGGASFDVSDLHAVAKLSSLLLVFDGLDEVADIDSRQGVVDEIRKGVTRLGMLSASIQTVVTSRPAAFANSPGLPEDQFFYLELGSLNRQLIDDYASKWLRARNLEGREASDVRRILREKMDQPHLRELARNPMQLAILLSLIHTRGSSLPDKRTALYDSYVDLFFNREAEKSAVVREHRDLLIDIHRHLAWILHSEAQTQRNRGSVSAERLQGLVRTYLNEEGHDEELVAPLFTGMVERVVALVSRVEGTYEFEVQPLREYFAARHLYDTAPYSPPGGEKCGTLPERFDAIARDFFWLNVTRFYAGCYSKGELPSLVDRLEELARADGYKHTSHPRLLAATLLSDWVFAQHPKSMRKVVAIVLDDLGLRYVAGAGARRELFLVLPKQSGNDELLERCFELLREGPPTDFVDLLIQLIHRNADRREVTRRWREEADSSTQLQRTRWFRWGLWLGALADATQGDIAQLMADDAYCADRLELLMRAGHSDYIDAEEQRFRALVDTLLDRSADVFGVRSRTPSFAAALYSASASARFAYAFQTRHARPLFEAWKEFGVFQADWSLTAPEVAPRYALAEACRSFVAVVLEQAKRTCMEWATELGPWNAVVEAGRTLFGDRWRFSVMANVAASVPCKNADVEAACALYDADRPLVYRARYARLRSGNRSWWAQHIAEAASTHDKMLCMLLFLTWAGPSVLSKLAATIDIKLRELDDDSWTRMHHALRFGGHRFGPPRKDISLPVESLPNDLSERAAVALAPRLELASNIALFNRYLRRYDGEDIPTLALCQEMALQIAQEQTSTWQEFLPLMRSSYRRGAIADEHFGYRFSRALEADLMPEEVAARIVEDASVYPTELVAMAERVCRKRVTAQIVPVGTVALREGWFGP